MVLVPAGSYCIKIRATYVTLTFRFISQFRVSTTIALGFEHQATSISAKFAQDQPLCHENVTSDQLQKSDKQVLNSYH